MRDQIHPRGLIALELASWGLRIHPLHENSKAPVLPEWQNKATTNPVVIKIWWRQANYNIGIATGRADGDLVGRELVGLDFDCKNGKPGLETFKQHALLGLVDTLLVRTGTGGIHALYWRRPGSGNGQIENSVEEIAPGVDVRGWHGYLVGPGSVVDGKVYAIMRQVDIGELPGALEEKALRGKGSSRKTNGNGAHGAQEGSGEPIGELDQETAIARARRYLMDEAPIAVEGAGGDNTTYRVACRCKDLGVSEEQCLELMLEHWNERCAPPWDAGDLGRKVRNAYAYGQAPPGSANAWEEFAEDITREKARAKADPGFYLEDLQKRPIVPLSWIVEGFILAGVLNGLFGGGGTGKDLLLLQLGISMTTGAQWLGRPVRQGRVLYLPGEDNEDELRRREDCITRQYRDVGDYRLRPRQFRIAPLFGPDAVLAAFVPGDGVVKPQNGYLKLREMIKEFRPDLVITGNRVNIFSVNQNDDAHASQCIALLTKLCRDHGTSIVMPGHVSVASERAGTGQSGSVQWSNGLRLRTYLRRLIDDDGREPDDKARVLETQKSNWSATGQTIAMHWRNGVMVPDTLEEEDADAIAAADDREVLRLLNEFAAQGDFVSPYAHAPNNIVARFSKQGIFRSLGRAAARMRVEEAKRRLFAAGAIVIVDGPRKTRRIEPARNET